MATPDPDSALRDLYAEGTPIPQSGVREDAQGALVDIYGDEPKLPGRVTGATPRLKRYAVQQRKQLIKKERTAEQLDIEVEQPEQPKGFWWFLDQLDRPRNAFHNVVRHWIRGDQQGLAGTLESFKSGWTAEERTTFEDILEEFSVPTQLALLAPLMATGMNPELAKKVIGFGGDMIFDPLNLFAAVGLVGKGAKAVGATGRLVTGLERAGEVERVIARGAVRAAGKGIRRIPGGETAIEGARDLAQQTFFRKTGFKPIDDLKDKKIDQALYHRSGLQEDVRAFEKTYGNMKLGHRELITQLAEENERGIYRFIQAARNRQINAQSIDFALNQSGRIRNPEAIRKIIDLPDEELVAAIQAGSQQMRGFLDKILELRRASGLAVPELGTVLNKQLQATDRAIAQTIFRIDRKQRQKLLQQVRELNLERTAEAKTLKRILGRDGMRELNKKLVKLAPEGSLHVLDRYGNIDPMKMDRMLRQVLDELQPGMFATLKSITNKESAAKTLVQGFQKAVLSSRANSRMLARYKAKADLILDLMSRVPSYVPHVATEEALERMAKLGEGGGGFLQRMITPKTSNDLVRRFQELGRPLSFEEIESVVQRQAKGGYAATAPGTAGVPGTPEDIWSGPLYKRRGITQLIKGEREMGRFFEVDPIVIMRTAAQKTARSISAAEYLEEASEIARQSKIGGLFERELTAAQKARWKPIEELPGWSGIQEMMPGMKGMWFRPDIGQAIVKTASGFAGDIRAHPVVRAFDSLQNWWVSMTLPMFPAFHARNMVGNLLNMNLAGFMDNPTDIADFVRATKLQVDATRNNVEAMKTARFYLKNLDQEIDGLRFKDIALRNGVINPDFYGIGLPRGVKDQIGPWHKQWKSFFPASADFVGVRAGKATGAWIENNARMTLFANLLKKGDDIETAAAKVKKFLGDYRTEIMTPFERNFMARLFPFYRWTRFNVPLQFEQAIFSQRNRAKLLALFRGQELGQEAAREALEGLTERQLESPEMRAETAPVSDVAQWIQDAAGVPVARDRNTGELLFWLTESYLPVADIDNWMTAKTITRFTVNSSPFVLTPLVETATGRSLFLDRALEGRQQEFLGRWMDASMVNFLRTFRILGELDRADPFKAFRRPEAGGRTPQPGGERALRFATGIAVFPSTPERERVRYREAQIELLSARIARARRALAHEQQEEEEEQ